MFSSLFIFIETAREGDEEENEDTQMSCIFPLLPLTHIDCAIKDFFISISYYLGEVMALFCFWQTPLYFSKDFHVAREQIFQKISFNVCFKLINANTINKTIHGDDSSLQFKSDLTENISIDLHLYR